MSLFSKVEMSPEGKTLHTEAHQLSVSRRLPMKGDIVMSQKELLRVEVLEKLKRKELTQKVAARMQHLSTRQIKRLVKRYRRDGAKGLVHLSRGRESNHKASGQVLAAAMETIRAKYWDFGPTLAYEKLVAHHQFPYSVERLRLEMIKESLWVPKAKHRLKIYQLRERRAAFGELWQLDGSPHPWFEDRGLRCNLNVDIDDATGIPLLEFSEAETTQGYFRLVEKHLTTYGLPLAFYADRHSIFQVNTPLYLNHQKPIHQQADEGLTQFGRAMKELGISLIAANSPQAKGRVEKINQTLQDRLVKELRLRQINTIQAANDYLPEFTKQYINRFAVSPRSQVDMHRPLPKGLNLTKILCLKEKRWLSRNLTCQYQGLIYQVKSPQPARLRQAVITICERYDGKVTLWDSLDQPLTYTTIKPISHTPTVTSKEINHLIDQVVAKRNVWESSREDLEAQAWVYSRSGAV
jgi:transposase